MNMKLAFYLFLLASFPIEDVSAFSSSCQRELSRDLSEKYTSKIKEATWKDAVAILHDCEQSGYAPNMYLYRSVISKCASESPPRWEESLSLLKRMRNHGVETDASPYNMAMKACVRANKSSVAMRLFEEMVPTYQVAPDAFTFTTMIGALEKQGKWKESLAVFDEMNAKGIEPSVVTYTIAIAACAKGNQFDRALDLFSAMKEGGLRPNLSTYSAIISACAKRGRPLIALQLFDEMKEKKIRPDVILYNTMISACANGAQVSRGLELFQEMKAKGLRPDVVSYSSIINVCEKGCRADEALKIFAEMLRQPQGVQPNLYTFNTLLSCVGKCGLVNTCLEMLHEMQSRGVAPDVISYNACIAACEKEKQSSTALGLFAEMKVRGIVADVVTYSSLISACTYKTQTALDLWDEMVEANIEPNVVTYTSTISACSKGNEFKRALNLFSEMKERGIEPNVICYGAVISACKGQASDIAYDIFCEMRAQDIKPNEICYSALILSLFDAKRYSLALREIRFAFESGYYHKFDPKASYWDLHDLQKATACMSIVDALFSVVESLATDDTIKKDIVVITGKGLNSEHPDGAVLKDKVPEFLRKEIRIEPTCTLVKNEDDDDGKFIITASNLQLWRESADYERCKAIFEA